MKNQLHLIIPTSAARHFFLGEDGERLPKGARLLLPVGNKEGSFQFPDGEVYLRVPGLKQAHKITIVHSGHPNPNSGLIELYMLLDIIRQCAATRLVDIVFTSMPYARQDNAYYEGELNAAKTLVENLIGRYDVLNITTIDAHFAGESWTHDLPLINVSAAPLLMSVAKKEHPNILFMAPDAGSSRRARLGGAKKKRENSYSVSVVLGEVSTKINGQTIGVVDDILATGTTLERFCCEAKRYGARKVYALITHGTNPSGVDRVLAHCDGLYMTNTIAQPWANVPVNGILNDIIGKSVALKS